jgi:6-phosphogluconate dehydrogenase
MIVTHDERTAQPGSPPSKRRLNMQIGMIGLGRMGSNMVQRLLREGRQCVLYDRDSEAARALADAACGGRGCGAGAAGPPPLEAGDIVIDGGNSYYRDDIRRAAESRQHDEKQAGRRDGR